MKSCACGAKKSGTLPASNNWAFSNRGGGPGRRPGHLHGADRRQYRPGGHAPPANWNGASPLYEGVYDVRNSYERGRPEIKLNIKPEAETLGLTLGDLGRQVRAGFYGEEVQRVQRGQDEVQRHGALPEG